MTTYINTPLTLTLIRLLISPLILPFLIVYLIPLDHWGINLVIALFFLLLCITDFFDGYLARRFNQVTAIGAMLDPLADKFLTVSALISLVVIHKIYFYWVVLLIGREFFVLGLRQVSLHYRFGIPVSFLAKLKTAVQMGMIGYIIYLSETHALIWQWALKEFLIASTIILSLYTAYDYARSFLRLYLIKKLEQNKETV